MHRWCCKESLPPTTFIFSNPTSPPFKIPKQTLPCSWIKKASALSCLLLTKEKSVTWATYCNNEVRFWAQLKLSIFRICKAQSQRLEVVCSITNWFEGFGTFPTDGEAFILECIFQLLPFFQVCFYLEKGNFVRSCMQINRNEPEPSNENSPKKLQRCMLESWSKCKCFHYQKLLEGPWY